MRNILLGTTGHNTTKPTDFIFYFANTTKSILIKIYLYREFQNVSGSQNFIRAYIKHDKTTVKKIQHLKPFTTSVMHLLM